MASADWTQYWPVYERLEKEFCELTFVISLTDLQLSVYSIRMAELLLRICSESENAAKWLLKGLVKGEKTNEMNFPTLGKYLCGYEKFNAKKIEIIWPYQSLSSTDIVPFDNWDSGNPIWYTAYNKIKHDRDSNLNQASYKNVLNGLAGLFILNLWLRRSEIESHVHNISVVREKVFSYSSLFSPKDFLQPKAGLSTFRYLEFVSKQDLQ